MLLTQKHNVQTRLHVDSGVKVSVIMLTYNHKPYISQAIDSVLMQETTFTYELVIGEDCSTDGTREIVVDYLKRYPENLRVLLPERNLGMHENAVKTAAMCKGEYIAYLDGDDYWIDRKKLQKQIEFLETNSELSMCFTGMQTIDSEGVLLIENKVPEQYRRALTQRDVIGGYVPPAGTVVARNYSLRFPACFYQVINVDYLEYALTTEYGNAGYLPDVTACHRLHHGGIWSLKDREYYASENLKIRQALLQLFGKRYEDLLIPKVDHYFNILLNIYIEGRKFWPLLSAYLRYCRFLLVFKPSGLVSKGLKMVWRMGLGFSR